MSSVPISTGVAPPPAPGRLLALRALGVFVVLDVALRLVGVGRVLEAVRGRRAGRGEWPAAAGHGQAERTFAAVQKATMFYYRRRRDCLPKAVTTFHLLRRQGLAAELCFGVRKFPFVAHSWVEAFGAVLDDAPERIETFTVIHRVKG
jgi:hypothetical protein